METLDPSAAPALVYCPNDGSLCYSDGTATRCPLCDWELPRPVVAPPERQAPSPPQAEVKLPSERHRSQPPRVPPPPAVKLDAPPLDPALPRPTPEPPRRSDIEAHPWSPPKVLTVGAVGGSIAAIYIIYTVAFGCRAAIERRLAANELFGPAGAIALYDAERAKSPSSGCVVEEGPKISVRVAPEGDRVFADWYRDSAKTDWSRQGQLYAFLAGFDASNREYLARKAYADAQVRFEARDFDQALRLYEAALGYKPRWVLALNGKAKVYVRTDSPLQDPTKAIEMYREAISADPAFIWSYKNLGEYYSQQSQWVEAEQYLARAAEIRANVPSIVRSLEYVRKRLRDLRSRPVRRARP